MGVEPSLVKRDSIVDSLDIKPTTYQLSRVDEVCQSGTQAAHGYLHRFLYPRVMTRTFDWPDNRRYTNRVDFDQWGLISATSVVSDNRTLTANTDYYLEPNLPDRPYEYIRLNNDATNTFAGGPQRAISITGLWGWTNDEAVEGIITADVASTAVTTVSVSKPQSVGTILRIGNERLIVTGQGWASSGQTASAISSNAATALAVSDGTVFRDGEYILLDSERMRVTDIAGNTLIVTRAVSGTVLAAHTSATIYRQTSVAVERGSLGTTAATATAGATLYSWRAPSLAAELAQAYAEDAFLQRNTGYARSIGTGEGAKNLSRTGIASVEKRAFRIYGRGARLRSV